MGLPDGMRICPVCYLYFTPRSQGGRPQRYCGASCRQQEARHQLELKRVRRFEVSEPEPLLPPVVEMEEELEEEEPAEVVEKEVKVPTLGSPTVASPDAIVDLTGIHLPDAESKTGGLMLYGFTIGDDGQVTDGRERTGPGDPRKRRGWWQKG